MWKSYFNKKKLWIQKKSKEWKIISSVYPSTSNIAWNVLSIGYNWCRNKTSFSIDNKMHKKLGVFSIQFSVGILGN